MFLLFLAHTASPVLSNILLSGNSDISKNNDNKNNDNFGLETYPEF